jgi:hypothetical protein
MSSQTTGKTPGNSPAIGVTGPAAAPARLHHFRWDLDKTYIRTDFDTRRDLLRTWMQSADEKRGIPGASTLLRELLRPGEDPGESRRVTFISGSPRQMRRVLTQKLRLDGIEPDQFILKPNLSNFLLGRWTAMRSQVGYKVEALLKSRLHGEQVDETLFGDDAEQDALVYCLYADLVAGAVDSAQLEFILTAASTDSREAERIRALASQLEPHPNTRVRRIFINLERRSPVSRFDAFGARVCPIYNYFQASLVLLADEQMQPEAVVRVLTDMKNEGYTPLRLANSVRDLVLRAILTPEACTLAVQRLNQALAHNTGLPPAFVESTTQALLDVSDTTPFVDTPDATIDYARACRDLRKYRREALGFPLLQLLE